MRRRGALVVLARRDPRFKQAQESHFAAVDADHFAWQVGGPGFAPLEAALLEPVAQAFAVPYLEVGCGEGANFVHVGGTGLRVGVDRFPRKLAFAATRLRGVALAAADATALPLRSATVRVALIRDLLHHLPDPAPAIAEVVRVLAPGGRLFVIEPNGRNPLVALQARIVPAEAGSRASRREELEAWLRAQSLANVQVQMTQPLPLRRVVLHYRFGLPSAGRFALVARTLARLEELASRWLPQDRWAYIVLSATRSNAAGGSP